MASARLTKPCRFQQTALKAAGCKVIRAEKRSGTTTAGREELKTVLDFPRDRRRADGHPYRSARPEYRRPQDKFGDFVNFDCILIDRKAFLAQIGRGFSVKKIREHDVIIRILGDFATIHARTSYSTKEEGRVRLVGTVSDKALTQRRTLAWEDVNTQVLQWMPIKLAGVNWFSTYHVHHRVADHFRNGRAFLLGDAAHIHSPVG